ncbi:MAG: glycosyltransferase family 2 protein [Caldiserica bacterium]|nr:glycosyltransferase family 2 protein [Caldisericota bacterium]
MGKRLKKICALIPAYQEEERIGEVVKRTRKIAGVDEVIVVDDGSVDRTSEVAERSGATVLKHVKNAGKGKSLQTGFSYAVSKGFDAVVTLDGDGQHLPEEIPLFIEKASKEDADIVVGSRMEDPQGMPPVRYWTNVITSLITTMLAGTRIRDSQSGFRLIRSRVLQEVSLESPKFAVESELLIKAGKKGFKIREIPITSVYLPDSTRKSKISPWKDTLRFFMLIWRNI